MGKVITTYTSIKTKSGIEITTVIGRISGSTFWCKPYTLTLSSKPTGVDSITCYRYSSNQPGASTGSSAVLTSGDTIYYGDVIYVSAIASTGYNDPSISSSTGTISSNKLTVDGNESITVTAGSLKSYRIRFYNEGSLLQDSYVNYGETPSYNGSTPTKPATPQYTYTFSGWSPIITPVTQEQAYYAQFTSEELEYYLSFSDSEYGHWNSTTSIKAPYSASVSRNGNTVYCNGESRTFYVHTNTSLFAYNFSLSSYNNDSGSVGTGKTVSANFNTSKKSYGMRLQGKFMYYNGVNNFGVKIIKLSGYEAFPVTCICTYNKGPGEGTDTDSSNIPIRSDDAYTTIYGGYWQGVGSVSMEIRSQGRIQTGGYFGVHTNTELYPEGTEYVDVYSNGVNQFSPDWYGNT